MTFKKVRKAIFPVGGLGTRFLPATKSVPKEMLPVASRPLIQYAFEEAKEAGIEEFIFITGRNKHAINAHFDHAAELQQILTTSNKLEFLEQVKKCIPPIGSIAYIPQQEPAGLGHAVWCARNLIGNEPFAIILPDEMVLNKTGLLKQMVDKYKEVGENIVAISEVDKKDTYKYGIIEPEYSPIEGLVKINNMVEKPEVDKAPSNLSLTGRYILHPQIFDILNEGKRTSGNEVQLTDSMQKLLKTQDFYGCKFEGKRFDCGSLKGFMDANFAYALDNEKTKNDAIEIIRKYAKLYGLSN